MRGQVFQREGSKHWTIKVSLGYDATAKKYRQHWESVKGTRKDAEKRLSEILHQLDTGNYMAPGKTTVADYMERWLKDYCWANLLPRTAEGYQYIVRRHIIPTLGQIPLTQLKPEQLQRVYSDKLATGRTDGKGGLSNRSVRYIHATLHKALKTAVKLGLLGHNPADAVEVPKPKRHEMQTMNESDVHIFLEYAKDTPYYALFYTALFTGMRRSELLALRWSDIDLLLCQLSVTRTLHRLHNGTIVFGEPKTSKSKRMVSLSPSTAIVLREQPRGTGEAKARSRANSCR